MLAGTLRALLAFLEPLRNLVGGQLPHHPTGIDMMVVTVTVWTMRFRWLGSGLRLLACFCSEWQT